MRKRFKGYTLFVIGMFIAAFSDKTLAAVGDNCSSTACDAATEFCNAGTSMCACNAISTDNSGTCTITDCTDDGSGGFECGSVANTACDGSNKCMCAATHTPSTTDGTCVPKGLSGSCEVDGGCVAVTYAVCTCMCMAGNTYLGDSCSADGDCVAVTDAVCTLSACACPATHVTGMNTCTAKVLGDTCSSDGDCTANVGNSACTSNTCQCANDFTEIGGACVKGLGNSCSLTGDCTANVANSDCTSSTCQCATGYTAVSGACVQVLGKSCTATTECSTVTNAYCLSDVCACGPLYTASSTTCVAKACSGTPKTCANVDNSACNNNDECTCDSGYTMDATTGACITVAAENGSGQLLISTLVVMIGPMTTLLFN